MNTPENTKPFDLSLAQQGHPLVTRDGRAAKFMGYEAGGNEYNQVAAVVEGTISGFGVNGNYYDESDVNDLFLAPVGYCEGLPVFPNDVLIGTDDNSVYKQKEFVVTLYCDTFTKFKWPSKNVVVKTRMGIEQLYKVIQPQDQISIIGIVDLANKAIERAISDGDVIPTSEVIKLVDKAITKWALGTDRDPYGPKDYFWYALQDYKDSLTK